MPDVEVEYEGKTGTVSGESAEELQEGVTEFAKKHGLRRFLVKDQDNKNVRKHNIDQAEKIKLLRTETAGVGGQ